MKRCQKPVVAGGLCRKHLTVQTLEVRHRPQPIAGSTKVWLAGIPLERPTADAIVRIAGESGEDVSQTMVRLLEAYAQRRARQERNPS